MSSTRFTDWDRSRMRDRLNGFIRSFHAGVEFPKFGDDTYKTYRNLADDSIFASIDEMMKHPLGKRMLDQNYLGFLQIPPEIKTAIDLAYPNSRFNCIKFYLEPAQPVPMRVGFNLRETTPEEWTSLMNWAVNTAKAQRAMDEAMEFVRRVTNYVNTPGQFRRVWADGIPFLMEGHQRTIAAAKKKSPAPHGIDIYDPAFIKQRAAATDLIAKGALLASLEVSEVPPIWLDYEHMTLPDGSNL